MNLEIYIFNVCKAKELLGYAVRIPKAIQNNALGWHLGEMWRIAKWSWRDVKTD